MEEIRKQVEAQGIDCSALADEQVKTIAGALGIEVPREVEIREHKGAMYLVTDGYVVPHKDPTLAAEGRTQTAKGLFMRIEAMPQVVADINAATKMIKK